MTMTELAESFTDDQPAPDEEIFACALEDEEPGAIPEIEVDNDPTELIAIDEAIRNRTENALHADQIRAFLAPKIYRIAVGGHKAESTGPRGVTRRTGMNPDDVRRIPVGDTLEGFTPAAGRPFKLRRVK